MQTKREWSADFSYEYYIKLLESMQENFIMGMVSDADNIIRVSSPACFLRHDIDVSIVNALEMASIEHDMGIKSTYYVRLNTGFYTINVWNLHMLNEIRKKGHEIGLHYFGLNDPGLPDAVRKLESLIKKPVHTVSYHLPKPEHLKMGLYIEGMINAYAPELMKWYMSDSSGRWRDGEPLPRIKKPEGQLLQVLIHPVWWGEKEIPQSKREHLVKMLEGGN